MNNMNYRTFAKSIKTKYPQYNNLDDLELSKKMIAKYPIYQKQVDFNIMQPAPMSSTIGEDVSGITPRVPKVKQFSEDPIANDIINSQPFKIQEDILTNAGLADKTGMPKLQWTTPKENIIEKEPSAIDETLKTIGEYGKSIFDVKRGISDLGHALKVGGTFGNAVLGTFNPLLKMEEKKLLWERVPQVDEQNPEAIDGISNTIAMAGLIYGGVQGVKALPEVVNWLKYEGDLFKRRIMIKERALVNLSDKELLNIYKELPQDIKPAMARNNERLQNILKQENIISETKPATVSETKSVIIPPVKTEPIKPIEPVKEVVPPISTGIELKQYNQTQIDLMKQANIPEKEMSNYLQNSISDSFKIGDYAKRVISNEITEQKAVELIKQDYIKLKTTPTMPLEAPKQAIKPVSTEKPSVVPEKQGIAKEFIRGYKQFSQAEKQAVNVLNKYSDSKIDVYGSFSTLKRRGSGKALPDLDLIIEDPKIAQDILDFNKKDIAKDIAYAKKFNSMLSPNESERKIKNLFEQVGRLILPEKYRDLSNKFSDVKIKINGYWFSVHSDGTARALGDSLIKEQLTNRKPLKQALADFYSHTIKQPIEIKPFPTTPIAKPKEEVEQPQKLTNVGLIKYGLKLGTIEGREKSLESYKLGRKEATIQSMIKFRNKELNIAQAKSTVESYVKKYLEPQDRGKFLTTIRTAKTPTDTAKAFIRVVQYADKQEIKYSISELKKNVEKLSESPSVSVDYRNKIKDIIGEYELTGHTGATIEKLKATQNYLDNAIKSGEDVELLQRLLNKLKILTRIPKNELTLNQVEGLNNEIKLLGQLGKTKWASKQALYEAEKDTRKNILLNTATPIKSKTIPKLTIGESPKFYVEKYIKARNYLQKSNIGLAPIDGLADLTGMQPMKASLDLDYGNYLTYNDDNIKNWYELTKNFSDSNFERIGAVAVANQKGGIERLANNGITAEEVNKIKLTAEEEKAYKFVVDTFNKEYPNVKKYVMDTYNEDVGQIDNYVSFLSDFDAMSDLEMYDRFGVRAEEALNRRTKTVEQGFTQKRAELAKNKLQLNIDKIFRRHIDDVAYMLTMGRDIKQYFEIVNTPEMREKLGDVGTLAWLQWLDLMARKGGTDGAKRIATLDVIRKNIGAGVLSFRLSSALVQFSSFSDTIGTLGIEWATRGATSIATSKEWRNFIMNNFPEIKKAVGDDIAFREFDNTYFEKFTNIGLKPFQLLDGIMRSVAASSSYQKLALEKGIAIDLSKPDKQLIQEATRLMRQSQGSSFFKDQPLSYTAGYGLFDNKSFNKTILTFQSFMLNRWDNIKRQVWRLGIKENNYKKASMSFFWLVLFAAATEEGIRRGTRKVIDLITGEEREEKSFINNAALNIVQSVPIAGQLVSSMVYSSNPVPVINTFEDLTEGLGITFKGKQPLTKMRGAVRAIGAGGSLLGIAGSSQMSQIISKTLKEKPKSKSTFGTIKPPQILKLNKPKLNKPFGLK